MTKQRSLKIALAVVWAGAVVFLLIFGLKLLNDLVLEPRQTTSPPRPSLSTTSEQRETNIYFADMYAAKLVPERRLAKLNAGTVADAKTVIEALIKGPQSAELLPTIPADTRLLNAYAIGDLLILDFTHELQTNHTGGSSGEILTVYSIVNTVALNIGGIRAVQVLVEGEEVESLSGHLDLTRPLSPNMKRLAA